MMNVNGASFVSPTSPSTGPSAPATAPQAWSNPFDSSSLHAASPSGQPVAFTPSQIARQCGVLGDSIRDPSAIARWKDCTNP